jgi:hypothetical protein
MKSELRQRSCTSISLQHVTVINERTSARCECNFDVSLIRPVGARLRGKADEQCGDGSEHWIAPRGPAFARVSRFFSRPLCCCESESQNVMVRALYVLNYDSFVVCKDIDRIIPLIAMTEALNWHFSEK